MYFQNLQEIDYLITIKRYVNENLENHSLDRSLITYLNNLKMILDNEITTRLASPEFKTFVNYDQNIDSLKKEVFERTNSVSIHQQQQHKGKY